MHEYPITVQIVKIAEDRAREAGGRKVRAIHLVVGDYSGFVGESIQMYFQPIAKGTLCEGASLDFVRVRPQLRCRSCGHLFQRQAAYSFECPQCGGQGGPSEIGKEFYIESIEIETP